MRKIAVLALAAALLCLAACGERPAAESSTATPAAALNMPAQTPAPAQTSAPAQTPTPTQTPTPAPTAESAPVPTAPSELPGPGEYRWVSDEEGEWILTVKENGTFSVIGGERIFNGEGWSVQADGTIVTGPTEAAGAAPFFDEFGCSVWRVLGEDCEPVY